MNPVFNMGESQEELPPPPYVANADEFDGFDEGGQSGNGASPHVAQSAHDARRASSVFDPSAEANNSLAPEDESAADIDQVAVVVPNAEDIYVAHDPDALVRAKRDALQEKLCVSPNCTTILRACARINNLSVRVAVHCIH